ncbi:MAG: hypothetical protein ACRD0K_11130 [Egibacteraceae bacterium]
MALILDTGALLGFERGNRRVIALVEIAQRERVPVRTTAAVVAQAWRSGTRQARLGRLPRGVDERSLDPGAARRIGALLTAADTADVVDGSVIDSAVRVTMCSPLIPPTSRSLPRRQASTSRSFPWAPDGDTTGRRACAPDRVHFRANEQFQPHLSRCAHHQA